MIEELLFRIGSYARYFLASRNTLGYGIHSPHLFYIARAIVPERSPYYCFADIEHLRRDLLRDNRMVEVTDFGTGQSGTRPLREIARTSLKSRTEAQLLFRLVKLLHAKTVVELGTSLGITTAYLAMPDSKAQVLTFEGCRNLAALAREQWRKLSIGNIRVVEGSIDETLPHEMQKTGEVDLAFIDANHTYEATMRYFSLLSAHAKESSIFVVDDIRHSRQMYKAWKAICGSERVTARMDLGTMGLLFFDRHYPKQTFTLRI